MKLIDKLLTYYNIDLDTYNKLTRDVNESSIPLFTSFKNIDKAKERILKAINNKEKILIYGDYDADGVLATSILVKTFKKLNYEVSYYVPSRYLDGYGLSKQKVILAKEKGFSLIITVDNGITAYEAGEECKKNNIDLIVTDHHEYDKPVDCYTYIHPKESTFSINTSGAVISFYLSYVLLGKIEPYLLSLAATSILSDSMPMLSENRNIVKLALKYLNKNHFNSFNLLSNTFIYDEEVLTMSIIPKINAVGRIEQNKEVNILVKYFTTDSYKDLLNIKEYLISVNEKRKTLSNEIINNLKVEDDNNSICLNLDILSGLTGLIANRFLMKYNKPTCIFSSNEIEGGIRGSIRSKNGCNLNEFLHQNKDLFIECGGHDFASGIVIKKENYELFKNKFNEFSKLNKFLPKKDYIEITLEDLTLDNFYLINSFSPFGENWKEPSFLIKNIESSSFKRTGKFNDTAIIYLNEHDKIIGFKFDFSKLENSKYVDIIGKYSLNNFKNIKSLNFIIEN